MVDGQSVAIGTPAAAGGNVMEKALPSHPQMHLIVDEPPTVGGLPREILYGGAGIAGLGLILMLVGFATGKTAASDAGATRSTAGRPIAQGTPTIPTLEPGLSLAGGRTTRRRARRLAAGRSCGGSARAAWPMSISRAARAKPGSRSSSRSRSCTRTSRATSGRSEHFLDEARLAATVHHPNVVAIQDLGKIGSDYAIVMEYVDGVDLERLLMSARTGARPVPVDVGLGILRRICDGLHAAHTASASDGMPLGIIHRDVKSANVLVSRNGGVKVVDFGIAKAATQSHLTVAGETKGTPSMMAPEQRVGEAVDVRADVYSVAAVGYEIVTNHGVNLDLASLAHLGVENWPHLPPPSTLRAGLPPELDQVLLGAMAFERDKRPADAAAFEAQFEAVMKAHGLSATDKDIGRWVESELAFVHPTPPKMPSAGKDAQTT